MFRFVDPTGERIELTGATKADRDDELKALRSNVGSVGEQLQIVEENGRYFVEITGSTQAFAASSPAGKAYAAIIGDSEIARVALYYGKQTLPFQVGGKNTTLEQLGAVGATGLDANKNIWVAILKQNEDLPDATVDRTGSRAVDDFLTAVFGGIKRDVKTVTAHEMGHALFFMQHKGSTDTTGSNQSALDLENKVRQILDPGSPKRTIH